MAIATLAPEYNKLTGNSIMILIMSNYLWLIIFSGGYDIAGACCYVLYQLVFLVWPIHYIKENALPPGSSIIVTAEQVSLIAPPPDSSIIVTAEQVSLIAPSPGSSIIFTADRVSLIAPPPDSSIVVTAEQVSLMALSPGSSNIVRAEQAHTG